MISEHLSSVFISCQFLAITVSPAERDRQQVTQQFVLVPVSKWAHIKGCCAPTVDSTSPKPRNH